jgi:prephenate dehydrogenase
MNPMIVGYKGEIGSFLLNGLLKVMPKALDIVCVDINETEDEVKERIAKSDVIFLCVPLDLTIDWIVAHKDMLKGKMVIEQCSLKEWSLNDERFEGLDIRSMHILFRPSQTPNLEDRRVGLIKCQFDPWESKFMSEITQSSIVWYNDIEEHNKEMAIQQALVHRTLLLLAAQLKGCKGSTFMGQKVIELSDRIKQGDLGLYSSIQNNKHLDRHLKRLEKDLEEFDISQHMG